MEPWSYVVSEDKFFVSDDFASETDEIARVRNGMTAWGLKPSGIGSNSFLSSNQDLGESVSSDVMKNSVANGSIRDVVSGKFQFPGEEESCSKPSSSIVSNSRDSSSLIDLSLGRFPYLKDVNFSQTESSSMTMMPAKKARGGSLSCQRPFCQVHGCRKDLSSSKDYHKRHKVCEIHSKTTKVIVNGIEQRFCQQCSRFHLLAEFDDGKRSCRKRLAGHNERRRKPHIGSRLERSSSVLSSFVCEDLLPQKYEVNQWCKTLKVEDGFPNSNPMNPQKYNNHHHPLMQNVSSSSDFDSSHPHHPVFHSPASANTIGNGDLTVLDSSSTNTSYGGALSLLSSQSHNSSIHSSGVGVGVPLITNAPSYSITQVSEKLMRVSPQNSTTAGMEPMLIPDGGDSVSYGISGIIPGSEFMNGKNQLSCEDGYTIDLLQLSSQLQRVEHERESIEVEEDSDTFFGLRIT